MPIVQPKLAKTLEVLIAKELASAFAGPGAPADQAASNQKKAKALGQAISKAICDFLLQDVQVAPGIPGPEGPTTGPGKLM